MNFHSQQIHGTTELDSKSTRSTFAKPTRNNELLEYDQTLICTEKSLQQLQLNKATQQIASNLANFNQANFQRGRDGMRAEWLAPNMYIDVYCHETKLWQAGIIEAESQSTIKVRLNGWSSRFCLVFQKDSDQLAPFKSKMKAHRGDHMDLQVLSRWHEIQQRVQQSSKTGFKCFPSAYYLTQFIRGDLFTFVLSILANRPWLTLSDNQVADFLKSLIELILIWLEIISSDAQFKPSQDDQMLYCSDIRAAIMGCSEEFMEISAKLCELKSAHNQYLAMAFYELNGFNRCLALLQIGRGNSLSLKVIGTLLEHMKSVKQILDQKLALRIYQTVHEALQTRLKSLKDEELRNLSFNDFQSLIKLTISYLEQQKFQAAPLAEKMLELQVSKQFLTGPVADKKIVAMKHFNDIIAQLNHGASQKQGFDQSHSKRVAEWLMTERVLEIIFIDCPIPKMIKNATDLIVLRESHVDSRLDQMIVKGIWNCCVNADKDIRYETMMVLSQLVDKILIETLAEFFQHLLQIDVQRVDIMQVHFVKAFLEGIFNRLVKERPSEKLPKEGLDLLGQICFQSPSYETRQLAQKQLIELIELIPAENFQDKPMIEDYMQIAYDNLDQDSYVQASLEFFSSMLHLPDHTQTVFRLYQFDAFWNTLRKSTNKKELTAARTLFIDLYLKSDDEAKEQFLSIFVDKMVVIGNLMIIEDGRLTEDQLSTFQRNAVFLIRDFVGAFVDDSFQPIQTDQDMQDLRPVTVCLVPDRKQTEIKVRQDISILQLMTLAAHSFELQVADVCIMNNGEPLSCEFMSHSIEGYQISYLEIQRVQKPLSILGPKHTLAQSEQFIETLLRFMQSEDETITEEVICLLKTLPRNRVQQRKLLGIDSTGKSDGFRNVFLWDDKNSAAENFHKLLMLKDVLNAQLLRIQDWMPFLVDGLTQMSEGNVKGNVIQSHTLGFLVELITLGVSFLDQNVIRMMIETCVAIIRKVVRTIVFYSESKNIKMIEILLYLFKTLTEHCVGHEELIFQDPRLIDTFDLIWTKHELRSIRLYWNQTFVEICSILRSRQSKQVGLHLFEYAIGKLQAYDITNAQSALQFLRALCIDGDMLSQIDKVNGDQEIKMIALILASKTQEIHSDELANEIALEHIYSLLQLVLSKFPDIKSQMGDALDQLFPKLVLSLLSTDFGVKVNLKSLRAREACMSLLVELIKFNTQGICLFAKALSAVIEGDIKVSEVRSLETSTNKSETGYVGLENLGNICYINSLLQQLYMIHPFRQLILDHQSNQPTILTALNQLFSELMLSDKQYASPAQICSSFKDSTGNQINVQEQKDIDEFLKPLLDQIEDLFKGTPNEACLKNLFDGYLINEVICEGCPHRSQRIEPFQNIQLDIKDKKSIEESLKAYVSGESMSGENSYECSQCAQKRNALKRQSFKRLPNVLCFMLKRYEIDYLTQASQKINDYCEFPFQLDMSAYSHEVIARNDLLNSASQSQNFQFSLEQQTLLECAVTDKYYMYDLAGVVIHKGEISRGHYYSLSKDRNTGRWLCFDDKDVTYVDPSIISDRAYGGQLNNYDKLLVQHAHDSEMRTVLQTSNMKDESAYLLIYERKQFIDQDRFVRTTDPQTFEGEDYSKASLKAFNQSILPRANFQVSPEAQRRIMEDNKRHWIDKYATNQAFVRGVLNVYEEYIQMYKDLGRSNMIQVERSFIEFFFKVGLKTNDKEISYRCYEMISHTVRQDIAVKNWLLQTLNQLQKADPIYCQVMTLLHQNDKIPNK